MRSGEGLYNGQPIVFHPVLNSYSENVSIDSVPDGAEIVIPADPALGTPAVTIKLDKGAMLGRKGRKSFKAQVQDITDPAQRAAYLAAAVGGIQGKLEKVGKYGSDVLDALYAEAGIDTKGRKIVVDEKFPGAEIGSLMAVSRRPGVDPALRRVAMAVIVNHPTLGYVGTATGAEERYWADQMERDITRVDTEIQLTAASLHDAWRAGRLQPDGTYEPRWKDDGAGGQVDIANTDYEDLPEQWKSENFSAATAVVNAMERWPYAEHPNSTNGGAPVRLEQLGASSVARVEELADTVHQDWLSRNAEWAEPEQLLPYAQLSEAEKQKDRDVVTTALASKTPATVEATRAWVSTEGMRFFDGRAGFDQTRELARVALDRTLPMDVRTTAVDRILTSPYAFSVDSIVSDEAQAYVGADDPALVDLTARLTARNNAEAERREEFFSRWG